MSGKPRHDETAKSYARRDPDGTVKSTLIEPQYPLCKHVRPDTAGNIRGPQILPSSNLGRRTIDELITDRNTSRGAKGQMTDPQGYEPGHLNRSKRHLRTK